MDVGSLHHGKLPALKGTYMDKTQETVLGFRDFLIKAWPIFLQQLNYLPLGEQEYLIDDWLQANWELLVERILCQPKQFLLAYNNGGDANGASDRIIFPQYKATHQVVCLPKKGCYFENAFDGQFHLAAICSWEKFVSLSKNGNCYQDKPPFDFVLLRTESDQLIITPLTKVEFRMKRIEN